MIDLSMHPPTPIMESSDLTITNEVSRLQLRLTIWVAAALLFATAVVAGSLVLVDRADWWRGFAAAGTSSALAAILSLPPLLWCMRRGLYATVAGYFAAAGLRISVSLGACFLAIKFGGYPATPTLLLMVPIYLATLAAETTIVARAIWNQPG